MNKNMLRIFFLTLLVTAPLASQKQATTLERLTKSTPLILHASIENVALANETLAVTFTPIEVLRGTLTSAARLVEPGHRHCGCALHGLKRGQRVLLFLDQRRSGLATRGGGRGIVMTDRGALDAVRALVKVTAVTARIGLLVNQLAHASPRVREDAALALPTLPRLETADQRSKTAISAALDSAAKTASPALVGLLIADARTTPDHAARVAWAIYLTANGIAPLASRVLLEEIPVAATLRAAPLTALRNDVARIRVARLLADTGAATARPLVTQLLTTSNRTVRREAAVALLALGSTKAVVEKSVGKTLAGEAGRTLAIRKRKRFQAIRP